MARLNTSLALLALGLSVVTATAQETTETATETEPAVQDLTLPPQIDPAAAPGDARLEPPPEERDDMLEAVVTRGQTEFNLPDLGSSMRAEEDVYDPNSRISVQFLHLHDPENQDPTAELFPSIEDMRRVGFLRVFELRFGRPRED